MGRSFTKLALGVISLACATLATDVIPYSDGQCANKITKWTTQKIGGKEDDRPENQPFSLGLGIRDGNFTALDGRETYQHVRFKIGDDDKYGDTSGYSIWWKIPQIGRGCRAIMMKDYTEYDYGYVGMTPGNVVLNNDGGDGGCVYTQLPYNSNLMMTFCCGSEDCAMYSAGYKGITSKRDLEDQELSARDVEELSQRSAEPLDYLPEGSIVSLDDSGKPKVVGNQSFVPSDVSQRDVPTQKKDVPASRRALPAPKSKRADESDVDQGSLLRCDPDDPVPPSKRSLGSVSARANHLINEANRHTFNKRSSCAPDDKDCYKKAFSECKIEPGPSFTVGGKQTAVSAVLLCSKGNPCSISPQWGVSSTTEMSVSSEYSFTSSCGVDISGTFGASFPVQATLTVGYSEGYSEAVSDTTSQSTSTSKSMDLSYNIGVSPGGQAFLSFTPSYTCYKPKFSCPGNVVFTSLSCSPNLNDNGSTEGEYVLVYLK